MTTYRPPAFQRVDWGTAVEESGLSDSRKTALLAIGSYVGWVEGEANHGRAWVSQGAVAQRAGLDRKTVNRAVQDAKEKGLLVDLGCKCGKEGRCVARGHTRVLGVSLPDLYVPGNVPRYVPRNVPGTRSSNTYNTTDEQVVGGQVVVEGRTESKSRSRAPSTKGQGQGRAEGSTSENLPDVEPVDGLVGQVDELLGSVDDVEPPEALRAGWTTEDAWCAFKGCPAATPDKSRFCTDHAEDVDGPAEKTVAPQPSKVSDNGHHPVDGPGYPAPTREHNGLPEVVWTCDNCGYGSMLIPRDGCPQCDGGKLTKREVVARLAEKPRPWKLKTCMLDGCNNERAAGADLCGFHYYEKLNLQCAWPLDRPGGIERCANTGRPFEPLQREDGWAPKLCDDHVAMLLDGTEEPPSPPTVRTEVVVEARPDQWPEGAIKCFNCMEPTQAYPCGVCGEDPSVEGTGLEDAVLSIAELRPRTTTERV